MPLLRRKILVTGNFKETLLLFGDRFGSKKQEKLIKMQSETIEKKNNGYIEPATSDF